MLRSLFALALALAPAVGAGCTSAATAELELRRPLRLTPVADPKGALQRVVEAVRADTHGGLDIAEATVAANDHAPMIHENYVTGPEKHVLEDYIRTHPELAPPFGSTFGYERQRDPDGRVLWRMHCLQQGGLELRKLMAAALVEGADDGRPRIRVRLAPEDAHSFADLTARHIGQRIAVVQDDEVLMAPVVLQTLTGGEFEILLGAAQTRGEAESALNQLLGR